MSYWSNRRLLSALLWLTAHKFTGFGAHPNLRSTVRRTPERRRALPCGCETSGTTSACCSIRRWLSDFSEHFRLNRRGLSFASGAQSALPGNIQGVLARLFGQAAFGPSLQFPGEFPPQVQNVNDSGILAEQGPMNFLQSGGTRIPCGQNSCKSFTCLICDDGRSLCAMRNGCVFWRT